MSRDTLRHPRSGVDFDFLPLFSNFNGSLKMFPHPLRSQPHHPPFHPSSTPLPPLQVSIHASTCPLSHHLNPSPSSSSPTPPLCSQPHTPTSQQFQPNDSQTNSWSTNQELNWSSHDCPRKKGRKSVLTNLKIFISGPHTIRGCGGVDGKKNMYAGRKQEWKWQRANY